MDNVSMKQAREKYRLEREKASYEDIVAQLEEASSMKDSGENDAADAIVNGIKAKLKNMIEEEKTRDSVCAVRKFDRTVLPDSGALLDENDKVILRMIQPEEREKYLSVSYANSCAKTVYKQEEYRQQLWDEFMDESAVVCTITDRITGNYVGYCSIKDVHELNWEIAIELMPEWWHKGYGTDALSLFLKKIYTLTGNRFFRARVDIDNYASQALMRKLGAYPNGVSEFMLKGEELENFKRENMDMINENIRTVACEFCMEPEDILGMVLEYRFDMIK